MDSSTRDIDSILREALGVMFRHTLKDAGNDELEEIITTILNLKNRAERNRLYRQGKTPSPPPEITKEEQEALDRIEARLKKNIEENRNKLSTRSVEYAPMQPALNSPPRIPRSPDPFNGGETADVINHPPGRVLFEACAKGGPSARKRVKGWRENTLGYPAFRDPQRVKGEWTVYFDHDGSPPDEVWRRVEGLSALHTKVALFFMARICDPRSNAKYPTQNPVGVSYEDLRSVLGFTKRGKAWEDFKAKTNEIVKDLADLKATVRGILINGKPDGIAECALFTISKIWNAQSDIFGEQVQIGWLVDPGPWARHYFNSETKPWLSTLHRALLELDHRGVRRSDVLALHIATLLFMVAGGSQFKERAITRTVAELLELAGELPEPEHRGANWANRTSEALSAALETLLGNKLLASVEYGPTYPDPGDRGRGWAERWLASTVTMTTPEAASILGQKPTDVPAGNVPPRLAKKRQTRKSLTPGERLDKTTAERLRARIAEHFPNQTQAAKYLGTTQSTLSRVLNRATTPKPELAASIRAFLDIPQET